MGFTEETIFYTLQDLENWKTKKLLHTWKKEFPDLIQNHLFNILNTRQYLNSYCFGELFTGIYYAKQGYKFLYEPWIENFLLCESKSLRDIQLQFQNIFLQHAGRETYNFITKTIAPVLKKGQPDLFVYNDRECFFAEFIICFISFSLVMSVGIAKEWGNFLASVASLSFDLAASTTLAPFLARSTAVASPIPDEAPVTMATLSFIFIRI